MTCRFLENLTLASLIAPVSEDEFRARYWETEPCVAHRKDPDYYDNLFTLQDFDDAIVRGPDYVKVANAAIKKNITTYTGGTSPALEATLTHMRQGSPLVF